MYCRSTTNPSGLILGNLNGCLKTVVYATLSEANMKAYSTHNAPLVSSQLQAIGGIPSKTCDLWEATGSRPEAKFTWDLTRNDNLEWPHKFRPRCRFDRLFMRDSQPLGLKPVYFELVGLERLEVCRRFCSDHWGLLAHLDKV